MDGERSQMYRLYSLSLYPRDVNCPCPTSLSLSTLVRDPQIRLWPPSRFSHLSMGLLLSARLVCKGEKRLTPEVCMFDGGRRESNVASTFFIVSSSNALVGSAIQPSIRHTGTILQEKRGGLTVEQDNLRSSYSDSNSQSDPLSLSST
jgi:hypothetical protein